VAVSSCTPRRRNVFRAPRCSLSAVAELAPHIVFPHRCARR
jgi:hypothetical protein